MSEMDADKRIVVTGVGMVTPLGIGKERFSENLFQGNSGIREIESFDTSRLPSHLGAEVRDFSPQDFISTKNFRRMDRLSQLAVASARLALEDAKIVVDSGNRDGSASYWAAFGPTDLKIQCTHPVPPGSVQDQPEPGSQLRFECAGRSRLHRTASGASIRRSIISPHREKPPSFMRPWNLRGTADVVLAGGAEILSEFFETWSVQGGFVDGRVEGAHPFDVHRNGPVGGEGWVVSA